MREFLTGLGILICVALVAAMAGPHFVDWGQYRAAFSREISEATGLPVVIEGPISLTLLPTPTLSLEQVRLGAPDEKGFRPVEVERIAGALTATSLLRGDFHVTEAVVDGLVLRFGPKGVESLAPKTGVAGGKVADAISIERLLVRDGSAVIERPGRPQQIITNINAELEATSILGPAKGSGSFAIDASNRSFRFALGRFENGRSRIKALLEDVRLALRFDVDGSFGLGDGSTPEFEGTLALSGNPHLGEAGKGQQVPLRAAAKARLKQQTLDLADVSISLGGDAQPFTLQGEGKVQLGQQPRYDLTLAARSFDFDRPGPDGNPQILTPLDGLKLLSSLAPAEAGEGMDGVLDLTVGGIIIGGQTIIGAGGAIESTASGPRVTRFEGEFPGQTRVRFARDPAARSGMATGRLDIESRDPERFNGWLVGTPSIATSAVALKAGMGVAATPDGIALEGISLSRGETVLSGSGSVLFAKAGVHPAPRLTLKLSTPRLNIADLPTLTSGGDGRAEKKEIDFDLDLQATKLVYENRETGKLVARLRRDGQIVSIERVALTEFDGANLIASGTFGGGSRQITVKLDADRLEGLTALGEKLLPGWLSDSLRKRARSIAPAVVVVSLSDEDSSGNTAINADGKLAGTVIKAAGKLSGKTDLSIDLDIGLDNPNGSALARQISGAPASALASGPGAIALKMRGNPRVALETSVEGKLAGLDARIAGKIRVFQPFVPFEGDIDVKSPDLAPFLAALGIEAPSLPAGSAGTLKGRVESNLERITVADFKADVAGSPISGEVAFNIQDSGKISGQIRLPAMDLRPVMALALGATRIATNGGAWSSERFGKALQPALAGDLWIEAERVQLNDVTQFDAAKFVLRFDREAASIEYSEMQLAGARVGGDLFLRRNGATGFVSARLKLGNVQLARMGGGVRGSADGEFQLSGSGETPAQMMAALAGNGGLKIRNLAVAGFEPNALTRLLAVPPQSIGPLDMANLGKRLENELDKGSWNVTDATLPIVFVNGVGRLMAVSFDQPAVRHDASGTVDLSTLSIDLRLASTAKQIPLDWKGALPQVSTLWRGPISAPKRSVAVDSLVNGYLAYALNRSLMESEIIEQDIRERGFFNRRLKAGAAQRKQEQEAAQAEAARQVDELAAREKAADEDRRRRIIDIIQQDEVTSTPTAPRAVTAPRRVQPTPVQPVPLAPPMNISPSANVRPPVVPPVEVRPLEPLAQ